MIEFSESELNWRINNLIEEIDSLGKAQKNALKGQIRTLIEHIIKRCYVDMPLEYNGWEKTIRNIPPEIEDLIETSPSLQNDYSKILDTVYLQCLKKLRPEYNTTKFPETWQFSRSLDDLLNLDFWASLKKGKKSNTKIKRNRLFKQKEISKTILR